MLEQVCSEKKEADEDGHTVVKNPIADIISWVSKGYLNKSAY